MCFAEIMTVGESMRTMPYRFHQNKGLSGDGMVFALPCKFLQPGTPAQDKSKGISVGA